MFSKVQSLTRPRQTIHRRFRELAEAERESGEEAEDADFSADETITMTEIAEHPAVTSITGVYKIVGMAIVSVSTLKRVKANEYEIVVKNSGAMGLHLVGLLACNLFWSCARMLMLFPVALVGTEAGHIEEIHSAYCSPKLWSDCRGESRR